MTIPSDIAPIFGSVLAALIAGAVAFLASVFTKENKTSEFRQAWIDGLRNDLAEFVSAYHYLASDFETMAENSHDLDSRAYLLSIKSEILKIELMQARIELRLNPVKHEKLIAQLHDLARVEGGLSLDFSARKQNVDAFIAACQLLLKTEWKRVKRGERTYWLTKWISLGTVVAAGLAGWLLWHYAKTPGAA